MLPRARQWFAEGVAGDWPAWPRRTWQRDVLMLVAVSVAFAYACGPYLLDVIRAPMPGGWDGMAHYAVAALYANHHYPAVSGWLPDYYAGMPFPNFYPPGLYFLVATVTKLGVDPLAAFVAVIVGCSFLVPILTAMCARRLCRSSAAGCLAGILTALYMGQAGQQSGFGVALIGTFDIGLASHVVGYCAFLGALFFLIDVRTWWAASGAAVCLAAVPLCNAHVAWNTAILGILWAALIVFTARPGHRRAAFIRVAAIGLVAMLLSAVWVLPLISESPYLATMAFPHHRGDAVGVPLIFPLLALSGALYLAFVRRNAIVMALCGANVVVLVIYLAPSVPGLQDAPLQPWRLMPPLYFLAPVLIAYVVSGAGRRLQARRYLALAACAGFVLVWLPTRSYGSGVSAKDLKTYESVLASLEGGGRVLVEVGTGAGDVYGLQVMTGLRGHRSLTTVFREASLSAFFAVPLRNRYSETPHLFGLDRKIDSESMFLDRTTMHDLERLQLFGVRYIVAKSARVRATVAALPGTRPLSTTEGWQVFEVPLPAQLAVVPHFRPALVFAPFSAKKRGDEELEFLRLNEEYFLTGPFDLPLVQAKNRDIDAESNLERFGSVVVIDYQYRDLEVAYQRLYELSKSTTIVLSRSRDPLFARLTAAADSSHSIIAVASANDVGARRAANEIISAVYGAARPVGDVAQLVGVEDDRHSWTLTLDRKPAQPVPIWVRQSFFPRWRVEGGDAVYMASPAFQLLFAQEKETRIVFSPGRANRLGGLLSMLALVLLALGFRASARRRWRLGWGG